MYFKKHLLLNSKDNAFLPVVFSLKLHLQKENTQAQDWTETVTFRNYRIYHSILMKSHV